MTWFEQAERAEQSGDWDTAIALVSAHAECFTGDGYAHGYHLWHMDLLVRAERDDELTELARTDVHARRRLNRALRDRGDTTRLSERARGGDRDALYCLLRLLCRTAGTEQARRTLRELDPDNQYARDIIAAAEAPSPDGT
ncbi:hypothetical protein [Streptomyces sp. NPDC048659]|uniref:hypothetical protein n=1 Tax=Streptomyces sp. NPDC048659 TaxID=3155489 RepID=UPI00342DEC72